MIITTDRLFIREYIEEDWRDVLAYQSDDRYLQFYTWEDRTPEDARKFVRQFINWEREIPRTKYQLAVVMPLENRVVGSVGLRLSKFGSQKAELGYELHPDFWGKGLITEASAAILEFGFTTLRLHRVFAQTTSDNAASIRVLERLGMQQEGRLRDNECFKGNYRDTLLYGLLEDEWDTAREQLPNNYLQGMKGY